MLDLPTPKGAAEAALFSECWDAVLSYADLCTSGSAAATQLARDAFALGIGEARAADAGAARGTGRRPSRLPAIPQMLTAVRTTAAAWEAAGRGHDLDPDLRLWLNSDKAARYNGPPLQRPLALRGLRDLQEADAMLLWLAEVEALPRSVVARRLGLDPAAVGGELDQVRGLFRDHCHRNHLDTPMDASCRSHARLLDAVTRSPAAGIPTDLSRHLATCGECAEAAACLRPHGGQLPTALAGGVIGWGGLAYLERRRRAAEVLPGAGRPEHADGEDREPRPGAQRARLVRHGLLTAAVLVSLVALAVSMMPFGGADDAAAADTSDRQPVAVPHAPLPSGAGSSASATVPTPAPATATATATPTGGHHNPDPEPQGASASTADGGAQSGGGATCTAAFDLVNSWPDGFQATVSVTTEDALDGWRVAWSFRDGQKVGQMWDASFAQNGSRVTATAADYNRSVPAGGTLAFGFLASWQSRNSPPYRFELNGHACANAG